MNRIFKTVFSRTRGAMMVANELTKSHQVGKKAAVAVAVVGALGMAGSAWAAKYVSAHGEDKIVTAEDIKSVDEWRVVGGWDKDNWSDDAEAAKLGNTVQVESGAWNMAIGGHYSGVAGKPIAHSVESTNLVINGGSVYAVVGGTGGSNNQEIRHINDKAIANITINGGTFGETPTTKHVNTGTKEDPKYIDIDAYTTNCTDLFVLGGDLLKHGGDFDGDINRYGESHIGKTNITINDGTFNSAIVGGSAAIVYYGNANKGNQATVDQTNVVINGGTFNHAVVAGGLASGHQTHSTVTKANLTIQKTDKTLEFNDGIYAGGLLRNDSSGNPSDSSVTVDEATVKIYGANVGDVYGTHAMLTAIEPVQNYVTKWIYQPLKINESPAFVKTDLTLSNASAKTVLLGEGSKLTVGGVNSIETLDFENADITGTADKTGKAAELTVTSADLGHNIKFSGALTYKGTIGSFKTMNVSGDVTINGTKPTVVSEGTITVNKGSTLTLSETMNVTNGATFTNDGTVIFKGGEFSGKLNDGQDAGSYTGSVVIDGNFINKGEINAKTFTLKSGSFKHVDDGGLHAHDHADTYYWNGGEYIDQNSQEKNPETITVKSGTDRFAGTKFYYTTSTVTTKAAMNTLSVEGGHAFILADYSDQFKTVEVSAGNLDLGDKNDATFIGKLNLESFKQTGGTTTIGQGSTLKTKKLSVTDGTFNLAGGTLAAPTAQIFENGSSFVNTDTSKIDSTKTTSLLGITATSGTIYLDDGSSAYYTDASLIKLTAAAGADVKIDVSGLKNYLPEGGNSQLVDKVEKPTEDVVASAPVTSTPSSDTVSTKINVTNASAQTITVEDSAAKPEDKKVITDVVLAPTAASATSKTITIVGTTDSKPLISNTTGASVNKVTVENGLTLQLGTASQTTAAEETKPETKGEMKDLVVKGGLDVVNMVASFNNLVADGGMINIGTGADRAAVKTDKLEMKAGSMIFLDPAWKDDAALDVIGNASHLEVANGADSTVAGNIVVGQNSIVTYGATVEQADAAFNGANMVWGKDAVTAALYLGNQIDVSTGSVAVDGSRSGAAGTAATTGNVELFANSLLMVDEGAVGEAAIKGKLVAHAPTAEADRKAQVAVINATDGKFTLASAGVEGIAIEQIVTDNQFVDPFFKDGVITTDVNEQKLAGAVASMGVQQMARRADTVIANTIADRTAQTIAGEGVSLWADVGGERYEADDLDNKAQYKANMFYGAFGADVGITPNARIGAAIQYGTGDSKSDNYNIKNDIDAVSLALYGSYNVTDAAKIVGEFAWTKTSNDVTSSERLLKNDIDADVISLGVRGQHEFKVGALNIVPSLGLRVSRISTDAFNVGAVKVDVDDQTLVQIPLSVAFSADIEQAGWTMKPYAKVSFTPSFGDDEINVRGYDQSAIDTMPVQGDFGLSATNGNVTFGAALSAGFGQDGAQNFGGKVSVRYAF